MQPVCQALLFCLFIFSFFISISSLADKGKYQGLELDFSSQENHILVKRLWICLFVF